MPADPRSDITGPARPGEPAALAAGATPISFSALAMGTGVGLAGAILGGIGLGLAMILIPPPATAGNPVYAPPFSLVAQMMGFAITWLAGYAAGRAARTRALLHAGLVGGVMLAMGGVSLLVTPDVPLAFVVVSAVPTIPAALLGGWAAERRPRRAGGSSTPDSRMHGHRTT